MRLRVIDILKEKGKTKYWLYIQMGLSYQNFSRIINNQTTAIKFDNLKAPVSYTHLTLPTILLV